MVKKLPVTSPKQVWRSNINFAHPKPPAGLCYNLPYPSVARNTLFCGDYGLGRQRRVGMTAIEYRSKATHWFGGKGGGTPDFFARAFKKAISKHGPLKVINKDRRPRFVSDAVLVYCDPGKKWQGRLSAC